MPEERPTMPPVRLRTDAELARDALAAPLLARAVRLARWAEPGKPVASGGVLPESELRAAIELLGLSGDEDGPEHAAQAWQLAVDTGLVSTATVRVTVTARTARRRSGTSSPPSRSAARSCA